VVTRILIGGFLIAHGLVHIAVWATPATQNGQGTPFVAWHSWLIGPTKGLAIALAAVVALILVAGGAALFAQAGLWRPLTMAGLAGSLFLDVLYFNPWFIFIGVVNGAFLLALALAHWPAVSRLGA
jgi:hypothetical protein